VATNDRSVGLADLASRVQAGPTTAGRSRSRLVRWREVPGFPGYSVSDTGLVKSRRRWRDGKSERLLTPRRNYHPKNGYLTTTTVVLFKKNKRHQKIISHVVLEAFVSSRPRGKEGCHEDGNPANNCLSNLRWGTHDSNMKDTIRHGRTTAKLSLADLERAKALRRGGMLYREIIARLSLAVGRPALSMAINGVTWEHARG
jgi:HNH endonuclease/NUMOD4 motif